MTMIILKFHVIEYQWNMKNPKLCKCGCGRRTNIITHTHRSKNQYAGDYFDWYQGHGPGKRASPDAPDGSHFCLECRKILPKSEFYRDKKRKSGLNAYCKKCSKYTNKIKQRNIRRAKLGVLPEDYARMLVIQNYVCAICKQPDTVKFYGKNRELSVDHCHKSGRVRGLLCGFCNGGLGMFKDDSKLLHAAVSYLESRICM